MIITSEPYDFPITGCLDPECTALMIIDMQKDFCDAYGYMHQRGEDISSARAIVPRIQSIRDFAKHLGITCVFTREGHRPNLTDLPESKRLKTARYGAEIGSSGPLGRLLIRGEDGWDFIDELKPEDQDVVIDKSGTGSFHGTDLDSVLRNLGIENLILTGVTTGVCVSSTAREAADRGYSVLVLEDCCAEPNPENHRMAIRLLQIEGGYLATISTSEKFLSGITSQLRDGKQKSLSSNLN